MSSMNEQKRLLSKESVEKVGESVLIKGWVVTVRSHGKIAFCDVRDRSGVLQVVATDEKIVEQAAALGQQDVVEIFGTIKNRDERYVNKELPTGTIELEASEIKVLQKAEVLPFDMAGKDLVLQLPTLLDYRTLTLRHQTIRPIFLVQESILEGFRKAAKELECVEIVVPTIAASATEGGADVFEVDYFEHKAFLTQSPQLYKQMMVPVFERVFTIAHAYRAEPSVTTYHLTESTQMDCEFGFVEFEDLLLYLETIAVRVLKHVEKECSHILSEFNVGKIAFGKIPRFTLREAQEIIFKEFNRDVRSEKDLSRQDEVDICMWALKNYKSDLVTITHFPTAKRAFYTMPDPQNPEYSLSYDLLFRGVEILSGSQRIHDYEKLIHTIKERGLDPKNFSIYLQSFQFGMPPEGGFSFGLERITMHILGLSNIREASLFPRDMERVDERFSKASESIKKTG